MNKDYLESLEKRIATAKSEMLAFLKAEVEKHGCFYAYEEMVPNVPLVSKFADNCESYYIREISIKDGELKIRAESRDCWQFEFEASDVCAEHVRYLIECMQ